MFFLLLFDNYLLTSQSKKSMFLDSSPIGNKHFFETDMDSCVHKKFRRKLKIVCQSAEKNIIVMLNFENIEIIMILAQFCAFLIDFCV